MKRMFMPFILIGLFVGAPLGLHAEPATNPSLRYYGKISSIEPAQNRITVSNKRRKEEKTFTWDDRTIITRKKEKIAASQLNQGQSLYVAYEENANGNRAQKIVIRDLSGVAKKRTVE